MPEAGCFLRKKGLLSSEAWQVQNTVLTHGGLQGGVHKRWHPNDGDQRGHKVKGSRGTPGGARLSHSNPGLPDHFPPLQPCPSKSPPPFRNTTGAPTKHQNTSKPQSRFPLPEVLK